MIYTCTQTYDAYFPFSPVSGLLVKFISHKLSYFDNFDVPIWIFFVNYCQNIKGRRTKVAISERQPHGQNVNRNKDKQKLRW
jgi:hypothetical protein